MSNKATTAAKKKLNIKEKVDEDRLDLSLCSLESVPIKEISEFVKVRKLNLSFNALTFLTEDFIKLQHIKELDLSKNRLRSLPKNFGQLTGLKSLDLLGNELTCLPSSFCDLKSLQWLDLKDNPLPPQLKQAAGDCLDEAQCKKCAINVIRFIKVQAADEERQRQIELKKKRDEQLKKEALEREKADELKLQKKQEREQRRLINEKKRLEREKHRSETNEDDDDDDSEASLSTDSKVKRNQSHKKSSNRQSSCLKKLLATFFYVTLFLLLSFGALVLLTKYCEADKLMLKSKYEILNNTYVDSSLKLIAEKACPVLEKNLPTITKILHFIKI